MKKITISILLLLVASNAFSQNKNQLFEMINVSMIVQKA
jgi:hypothetical protein